MKSKPFINEWLVLAAAVFSPVYLNALHLVDNYKIDIGHLGGAVIELVTIPSLILPLFVFVYSVGYMIYTKRFSVLLFLSILCSGYMLGSLIMSLFSDAVA